MDIGMVTSITTTKEGAIITIMTKEPVTVTTLAQIGLGIITSKSLSLQKDRLNTVFS